MSCRWHHNLLLSVLLSSINYRRDLNFVDESSLFLDDSSYFEEPEDIQRAIYARQSTKWRLKVCCVLGIVNHREKRKAIATRLRPFSDFFT